MSVLATAVQRPWDDRGVGTGFTIVGGPTFAWQATDDDPDSPNDSDYVEHDGNPGGGTLRMYLSPVADLGFSHIRDSVKVKVRWSISGYTSGTHRIRVRLQRFSDSTDVTDVVTVAQNQNSAFTNTEVTLTLNANGQAERMTPSVSDLWFVRFDIDEIGCITQISAVEVTHESVWGHPESQTFTGESTGQALSALTGWTTYQVSGTGVMSLDIHDAGQPPVIDMSTEGEQLAVWDTAVTDHHYAECDVMADAPDQGTGNFNRLGPLVRGSQSTATATLDGYTAILETQDDGAHVDDPDIYFRIFRVDNGSLIQIETTANIKATWPGGQDVVRRVRLEANGPFLFAYLDGVLMLARDISGDATKYETGTYTGVLSRRGEIGTPSQPWWDNFAAGALPIRYVGVSSETGGNRSDITIAKPTGTAEDDLVIFAVGWYDTFYDFSPPTGFTAEWSNSEQPSNAALSEGYWKIAGASEPANYTAQISSGSTYSNGAVVTLRPNTGWSWGVDPVAFHADWGSATDGNNPIYQPGGTPTMPMAFAVGFDHGFDTWTPGNNSVPEWTLIDSNDSDWLGVFVRQLDAAVAYANESHGEGETGGEPAWANTIVLFAEEATAGPQTWIGSTATIRLAAVSGTFVADQTWAGTTATVQVSAVFGSFVAGPITWTGSTAATQVAPIGGSFVPGEATWAGSTATVQLAATSGSFVGGAGPQTWTGSTAIVSVQPIGDILVPTLSLGSKTSSTVTLEWTGIWRAQSYEVRRDSVIVQTGITDLTWTDTGLSPSTSYDYEVRARFDP